MTAVHAMTSSDYHADMATVNKLCKGLGVPCVLTGGARRNLFGGGVEQNIAEQLTEQVIQLAERSSKDWNFDFMHESPLPGGRFAWERVPDTDVPRWYTQQTSPLKSRKEGRVYKPEKENAPLRRRHSLNEKCSKSLLQTSIKGFSRVQKRRSVVSRSKSKHSPVLVRGPSLVADYLLESVGPSQCS